jgi:hypothetical protein
VLHSYGFEHLFTLNNLEKSGLLTKQEMKNNWQLIKKGLKLVPEESSDVK